MHWKGVLLDSLQLHGQGGYSGRLGEDAGRQTAGRIVPLVGRGGEGLLAEGKPPRGLGSVHLVGSVVYADAARLYGLVY